MIYLRMTPKLKLTFNVPQSAEINLTTQARTHYFNKLKDRENPLVTTSGLQIPPGVVQAGVTYIEPELTLASVSEEALLDFANSFFLSEETDLFTIERLPDNDLPDL